jgi:hypothetical protein
MSTQVIWVVLFICCVCSTYFILYCTLEAIIKGDKTLSICGIITIVTLSLAAGEIFGG